MAMKFWIASSTRYLKELADSCGATHYATTLGFFLPWDRVTSCLTEQGSVSLLILLLLKTNSVNSRQLSIMKLSKGYSTKDAWPIRAMQFFSIERRTKCCRQILKKQLGRKQSKAN